MISIPLDNQPLPLHLDADSTLRVGGSRVSLDQIIAAFLEGETAEEMVERYPTLKLGDVYSVLGFYLNHRAAVDEYLLERAQAAGELRAWIESEPRSLEFRARLLARLTPQA